MAGRVRTDEEPVREVGVREAVGEEKGDFGLPAGQTMPLADGLGRGQRGRGRGHDCDQEGGLGAEQAGGQDCRAERVGPSCRPHGRFCGGKASGSRGLSGAVGAELCETSPDGRRLGVVGEGVDDLQPFDGTAFAKALFAE